MATNQAVVTQLTIDASGANIAASQYSASMEKAQAATEKLTAAIDKTQAMLNQHLQAMKNVSAANDNASGGMMDLADKFNNLHDTAEKTVENILNTVNHLKLLAVAAYAASPALRSIVNTELAAALGLIKNEMPAIAEAFAKIVEYATPILAFFAKITAPILAAVVAWKALIYVWDQGSSILQKYSDAEAKLYSTTTASNLSKLTQFQTNDLSADQVLYASQLAARMAEAKQTISQFWEVEIDVTNIALKLQAAWVTVLETIASATRAVEAMMNAIPSWFTNFVSALAAVSHLSFSAGLPSAATSAPQTSVGEDPTAKALAAARQQLAAAMGVRNIGTNGAPLGGSFAARFSSDIDALAGKPDEVKKTADAYQLAVRQIKSQIGVLDLEAQGAGKTSQAVQELKVEHQLTAAAMKAGIPITEQMRAEWKKDADQIADLTIKINQMKVLQQETFKNQTMFMSPSELAAANAAKSIDHNNWMAHLQDAGPQMAALNIELSQARDLSVSFADNLEQGLMQGKNLADSLKSAFSSLESQLIQMATKNLINQIFGGLFGGGTGGGGFNLFKLLGFADGGSFVVPAGPGAMALPGFANGADFTVPGSGSPDSKVTAFRVSPGERITVTPPNQSNGAGGTIQIQIAATVDKSGNLIPLIQNVSGQIAGQRIESARPSIVSQSVQMVARTKINNPTFLGSR